MSDHRKQLRRQIRRATHWPQTRQQPANPLAVVLSGLDVLRVLEENTPKYLLDVLHYGPGSFAGDGWAAVLVWFRRKGYHQYQALTLFGVWAVPENEQTRLVLGTKPLQFSAPVYNAESYHQLIQQGFKTYYGDTGSPPTTDNIIFTADYDPTRRLALRQEVADAIVQWLRTRLRD